MTPVISQLAQFRNTNYIVANLTSSGTGDWIFVKLHHNEIDKWLINVCNSKMHVCLCVCVCVCVCVGVCVCVCDKYSQWCHVLGYKIAPAVEWRYFCHTHCCQQEPPFLLHLPSDLSYVILVRSVAMDN